MTFINKVYFFKDHSTKQLLSGEKEVAPFMSMGNFFPDQGHCHEDLHCMGLG